MNLLLSERARAVQRTLIRRIFDDAPDDAINLGLGEPDLSTPDPAAIAGIRGIVEGRTGYGPTAGDIELRRRIIRTYAGDSGLGPENVLITVGSQEALFLACLGLLEPGSELLYPDPGYPAYSVVAELVGARAMPYPLKPERSFRLDPEDVIQRLTDRTRAVLLCSPSNPTGACVVRADVERLCGRLREQGVAFISDEVYAGLVYGEKVCSPASCWPDGGVVVSSLSKDASMTGWRVGWLIGPGEIVERLTALHQYLVTCAPRVSQTAAIAAFSTEGLAVRRAHLERFRRRREVMAAELRRIPGLRFDLPDGAFYFFVDVSVYGSSLALARRLLDRRRLITIPGEAFGSNGAGFLRISFAADRERIREGVKRLARELGSSEAG